MGIRGRITRNLPAIILELSDAATESAADCRSGIVNTTAVTFQKLAAVLDQQKKPAIQVELQTFCPEFFQGTEFCGIQLHRRESPAAVCVAAAAVVTAVERLLQYYAMPFDPLSSEKLHMVTSRQRI